MKTKILVVAAAAFAAWSAPAMAGDIHIVTRQTDKGCVFYDLEGPESPGFEGMNAAKTASVWTWDGPCEKGKPISGQGTLIYTAPRDSILFDGKAAGKFVAGYRDGPWSGVSKISRDGEFVHPYGPVEWIMGCTRKLVDGGECEPQTPGPTEEQVAAADEAAAEAGDTDDADEAGEPGGPDHVTEISEGGRETDRFIAARVSKGKGPAHHPEHDVTKCLDKYLEEHAAPHNHYVLYNKCDAPVNAVWCVMGSDCESGSGSLASLPPHFGYMAGMEGAPGMIFGACSGKVWPVMEGGKMVSFGCE